MKILNQIGNSQIAIEERERPRPGAQEVVIKTVVSALCGSEMKAYHGQGYPAGNMGHEAAGIVDEIGEDVTSLRVGQRVGVSAIAGCGHCDYCNQGQYTWCANYTFHDNMHAEYFKIPALACHVLPDDLSWEVGVIITGDALGVPYHTSRKINSEEIKTVAVFGLGPVGLSQVLMQTYLGRRVIGIDRAPDRLELARQLGAETIAADQNTDVVSAVREATNGRGPDVCLECAGVPATVQFCFDAVRTGGTVVFNGEQPRVELSPSEDFIRRDITAVGSWFYHFSEYAAMLELSRAGLAVASLITHRFPIEQAAEGYRAMEGKSGKVLLEYGENL